MAVIKELKTRSRKDYPFLLEYRTRWNDNDMYDHMNNSVYNFLSVNPAILHPYSPDIRDTSALIL
ncbi:hypothetical protein F4806DRAFT_483032 [Annulohypoxylon nitens]|nr:hypothetical protein F4806DRAFT_483032 [Annulohypoxylon nitens]